MGSILSIAVNETVIGCIFHLLLHVLFETLLLFYFKSIALGSSSARTHKTNLMRHVTGTFIGIRRSSMPYAL